LYRTIFYYICIRPSPPKVSFYRQNNAVGREEIVGYLSRVRRSEIYRRRRLGALLVASTIVYYLYASAGAGADPASTSYLVRPGDTLWEVATEHYSPSQDPRAAIEAIRRENGLDGYVIRPGTRLELPSAAFD
jgi:hypothetical protein